ncbi:MAG TPA: hypothetical protein VLW54_05155 [Candidatus Acidoferrales bacterium]|nr:hypothetical protein [Candidatus Acidoferrales bacterium]
MPSKRRINRPLAAAVLFAAAFATACSPSTDSSRTGPAAQAAPTAPAVPDDVASVARAAVGPEGEAVAWGDFPAAGGRQVLAINRLAGTAPAAGGTQTPETAVEVTRVSLLVLEGASWKEAFHAAEHLTNRRGYLDRMRFAASSWRMSYEKTPQDGFRLSFTPLNAPQGTKQETVQVAWNPKRKEYDSLDASGTRFLEPLTTPEGTRLNVEHK